jgi:TolC family type I secretion outer membrane protein
MTLTTPKRTLVVRAFVIGLLAGTAAFFSAPVSAQKDPADTLMRDATMMQAMDPATDTTAAETATSATALRDVFTLGQALRHAYATNPSILAARKELLATQERLPQAQAWFKPTAQANAEIAYVDSNSNGGTDSDGTEKTISASIDQPLYRGGRTVSSVDSAKNLIMAQRAFLNATEQDVLLQVVTAYMNVLRDQSLYDLAVNNRTVIERQLEASRARFEVGDVTRTDVSQSESRLAGAEASVVQALGNLRASRAVFREVTGIDAGENLAFPQPASLSIPATLNESVDMAEKYNPSVLASMFLAQAAQKDIDVVFGELLPSVGLFARVSHVMDPVGANNINNRTTSTFGVGATVPLYEGGATRSRVRAAKSTAAQRKWEVDEATRLARRQTVSAWEALAAAQSEIISRRAQVEANRIARDGVKKEAELGTRTILDALNADQELLDAESALVTAQRNEVVARYTLATTLGLMTPGMLGFPELENDYNRHIDEITGKVFSTSTESFQD